MTAGGAPVWALLKPSGLLALLVAIGGVGGQPRRGAVEPAAAEGIHGAGAHRPDRAGHPALALHRARAKADGAHPRSRRGRQSARVAVARRPRSEAGCDLPGRTGADHQAGQQLHTCAWRRGISCGARSNETAPQIIAFAEYVVDFNQLEQRADQTQSIRPRERYTPDLIWPEPNDAVDKSGPGRAGVGTARAPFQPALPDRLRHHRRRLPRQRTDDAPEPPAGRDRGLFPGNALPHPGHCRRQRCRRAARPPPTCSMRFPSAPDCWALFATYRHAVPRPPTRAQRHCRTLSSPG